MKQKIYIIDFHHDDWYYIGSTKRELTIRLNEHNHRLKTSQRPEIKPTIHLIDEVEDAKYWEEFYIAYFKYIGTKLSNSSMLYRGVNKDNFTNEHKTNISINRKGKYYPTKEHKLKLSKANLGKRSEAVKESIRNGKIGSKYTEKHKQNISNSLKGNDNEWIYRSINQISKKDGKILNTFPSITHAANYINQIKPCKSPSATRIAIQDAASPQGRSKTSRGFIWEFVN